MKNTANTETPNAETSVLLRIEGVQTDTDGNTQRSAQEYPARYMARGDSHLLRYRADREEAVLCLSRGKARMQRGGSGGTDMVFDPLAPSTDCAYRDHPHEGPDQEDRPDGRKQEGGGRQDARAPLQDQLPPDHGRRI